MQLSCLFLVPGMELGASCLPCRPAELHPWPFSPFGGWVLVANFLQKQAIFGHHSPFMFIAMVYLQQNSHHSVL